MKEVFFLSIKEIIALNRDIFRISEMELLLHLYAPRYPVNHNITGHFHKVFK